MDQRERVTRGEVMSETVSAAAVPIAADVLAPDLGAGRDHRAARAVVAALARAGWLHDPAEVAALRAVADAAQARREAATGTERLCRTQDLHDALDALPPADGSAVAQGASDLPTPVVQATPDLLVGPFVASWVADPVDDANDETGSQE